MTTLLKLPLTRDIAQACATDAGDRSMRQAGRSWWSEEDYNAAVWCWNELQPQAKMEDNMSLAWEGEWPAPEPEPFQYSKEWPWDKPPEPLPEGPSDPDESVAARNFRLWCEWEEYLDWCDQIEEDKERARYYDRP